MRWSIGSTWHRWDPHIHAPGTLKQNDYGAHDDATIWERYFAKIRAAQPPCAYSARSGRPFRRDPGARSG